jgi:hypothetical protein
MENFGYLRTKSTDFSSKTRFGNFIKFYYEDSSNWPQILRNLNLIEKIEIHIYDYDGSIIWSKLKKNKFESFNFLQTRTLLILKRYLFL